MGKTGKWLKSFLTGKKEKDQKSNKNTNIINDDSTSNSSKDPKPPVVVVVPRPTTPNKEKKRWSFRRSSASNTTAAADATNAPPPTSHVPKCEPPKTEESVVEVTPQQEVVVVIKDEVVPSIYIDREGAAALRIQAVFRSYLARKALKALRGLVKLQALVRGHLVRKQATATLRCMQALVTAQARARAQRIRDSDEGKIISHRQSTYNHTRNSIDKIKHPNFDMEENIKIVEMDQGEYNSNHNNRNSYSTPNHQQIIDPTDFKMSAHSPAPSAITDISPRTCSNHFEDYSFFTAQSSPQCYSTISRASPLDPSRNAFSFPRPEFADTMSYDFPLYPNYMANTESSRAKVRSQSAPKQRPPEFERQPSRGRRPSVEGRNIPKAAKMLRSSSHVGSNVRNHQFPWSVNLEKSSASLKGSECGSTCSVATNAYYCRSVISYDPRC